MLHLDKPLVILDLETTGLNLATDRILEFSFLKVHPDQQTEVWTERVNPGIPIPAESTMIHGISDADVQDKPSFKKFAPKVRDFIGSADIGGYNSNKFDVPILIEEFLRADIGFDTDRKYIDVMRIFTLMEKRDLTTAYQFFCGKNLEDAHSAEADVRATYEVLLGQLKKYGDKLDHTVPGLHKLTKDGDFVDSGRRMVFKDGKEFFNFGKHRDKSVEEIFKKEPQYFDWILHNEFPLDTKLKLKMIRLRLQQKNK